MKKMMGLLLSAAMILSLAACGGDKKPGAETLTGTARGFGGDVTVTLTREDGTITACSIEGKDETPDIGGAALPELEKQVVAAGGYDIDGVSGATYTSDAVKAATAAALGQESKKDEAPTSPAPSAPTAPATGVEGGLQLGMAYGAPHGNKSFGYALAAVRGDTVVAAYFDEFQFVDANAGLNTVPNSDALDGFAAGIVEGKALASKRSVADYYSGIMAENGNSTVRIDDNFDAIQSYAVGKTIAELESMAGGDRAAATDAVSGATLADTAGYLGLIAQAAKSAQATPAVEFDEADSELKLNAVCGIGNGDRGFAIGAALTAGDTIVLSYLDELQFVEADAGLNIVPNGDSTEGLAANFAEGQALASKRCVADYYSDMMTNYAGSTVRIDDNFDAIQAHVNGMTISEAKTLSASENAVDAVSGATLVSTADYVGVIVSAAEG